MAGDKGDIKKQLEERKGVPKKALDAEVRALKQQGVQKVSGEAAKVYHAAEGEVIKNLEKTIDFLERYEEELQKAIHKKPSILDKIKAFLFTKEELAFMQGQIRILKNKANKIKADLNSGDVGRKAAAERAVTGFSKELSELGNVDSNALLDRRGDRRKVDKKTVKVLAEKIKEASELMNGETPVAEQKVEPKQAPQKPQASVVTAKSKEPELQISGPNIIKLSPEEKDFLEKLNTINIDEKEKANLSKERVKPTFSAKGGYVEQNIKKIITDSMLAKEAEAFIKKNGVGPIATAIVKHLHTQPSMQVGPAAHPVRPPIPPRGVAGGPPPLPPREALERAIAESNREKAGRPTVPVKTYPGAPKPPLLPSGSLNPPAPAQGKGNPPTPPPRRPTAGK